MALITSIDCAIPRPNIAELRDQLATEISQRMLGGAPVLPMSSEDVLAFIMAGTINLMHGFVGQALRENDPSTMCCDNLVSYGAMHGVNLRASTRAKGYVAVTGVPGSTIPANLRFVGESSREYKLDPGVNFNPTAIDVTGHAVLRVVSALAGGIMNLAAGNVLTVSTTFPGIDMNATVVGNGLGGGTDNETCDQLRQRIINIEASGVITTNMTWYLQETSRFPGVTRACFDECEDCCDPNWITIYPFMDDVYGQTLRSPWDPDYGVPLCAVIDEMNRYMWGSDPGRGLGLAPVAMQGRYMQALPTYFDVIGYCHTGCDQIALGRMVAAINTYLRAATCVGTPICMEQLRSAIYVALGTATCFSRIDFEWDDSMGRVDESFARLGCGHFAVLRNVCVEPILGGNRVCMTQRESVRGIASGTGYSGNTLLRS